MFFEGIWLNVYSSVKSVSEYQPVNVYPVFVGDSGSSIFALYISFIGLTALPPFELNVIWYSIASHPAYSVMLLFIWLVIFSILFLSALSVYHPLNVYPVFVGASNVFSSPVWYVDGLFLLFVPPFNLYVITFAFAVHPAYNVMFSFGIWLNV